MTLFTLTQVTPPAVEPVTLAQAKAHLRVDITDDDAYITALISAARVYAEHHTRRAFITQTWDMYFDQFHYFDTREIQIPLPALQSVTWINYTDTGQQVVTLDPSLYVVDPRQKPGRVYPAFAQYWPATLPLQNSVNIRFVAGYGADGTFVPNTIIQAMLFSISHWYENREPVVAERGVVPQEVPFTVDALLDTEKVLEFA